MLQILENLAGPIEKYGEVAVMSLALLLPLGWIEWLWTGFQLHSFAMVFMGLVLPLPFAIPTGLYMLAFGVPDWVQFIFG